MWRYQYLFSEPIFSGTAYGTYFWYQIFPVPVPLGRVGGKIILAGGEIMLAGGKIILAGRKIILAGGEIILAG